MNRRKIFRDRRYSHVSVYVEKKSRGPHGIELTTVVATYPRFIHAELMTHRMFSRNAASSRAIPVAKQIKKVRENPVVPFEFGRNKPGMVASDKPLTERELIAAEAEWREAAKQAANRAEALADVNVHKQVVNRILEPFLPITTIITSTDWNNMFHQRIDKAAQPEFYRLALLIRRAIRNTEAELLKDNNWHLPFIDKNDYDEARSIVIQGKDKYTKEIDSEEKRTLEVIKRASAMRCARVSYENHDGGKATLLEDYLKFHQRLMIKLKENKVHWSPLEHQAMTSYFNSYSGNFRGWVQFRKMFPNEYVQG